jgi:cytochrome P450
MPVIHSDSLLAVIAGSNTTATAITVFLYHLILVPPKFDRLRNEVDTYFLQGEEPLEFARQTKC